MPAMTAEPRILTVYDEERFREFMVRLERPRGATPMNQQDFLQALESSLQFRGVAFSRAALQAFVESAWPLMAEDPDPEFWAGEFIRQADVTLLA